MNQSISWSIIKRNTGLSPNSPIGHQLNHFPCFLGKRSIETVDERKWLEEEIITAVTATAPMAMAEGISGPRSGPWLVVPTAAPCTGSATPPSPWLVFSSSASLSPWNLRNLRSVFIYRSSISLFSHVFVILRESGYIQTRRSGFGHTLNFDCFRFKNFRVFNPMAINFTVYTVVIRHCLRAYRFRVLKLLDSWIKFCSS